MMRRFEFVSGTSAKFWEIRLAGTAVTVRFGRLAGRKLSANCALAMRGSPLMDRSRSMRSGDLMARDPRNCWVPQIPAN